MQVTIKREMIGEDFFLGEIGELKKIANISRHQMKKISSQIVIFSKLPNIIAINILTYFTVIP